MSVHLTACPRNCYSTCSMRVTVEGGRLVRIEGVPENRATPEGPCLKGLAYVERAHSPQRIVEPLRRQPDGSFVAIPWEEAIETIASQLERLRAAHGPQTVLYYTGSGTKGLLNGCGMAFWRLFGGCTTTYGDLCWPAGLEATRLTLGANSHNAPWDLEHARLIVLWGKNAAETNVHQMPHVDRAQAAGARVVVIDPRRTETAERAELLAQLRPGTDGALALGLGHLLVRNGHVDHAFVERHVKGFAEYARAVGAWTPERVAAITELPVATIEALARLIGTVKPMTIVPGFGMQRFTNSGQSMRAMLALCAITGNLGKPGAGWMYANLQTQVFSPVKDPLDCYPIGFQRRSESGAGPRVWAEESHDGVQRPERPDSLRARAAVGAPSDDSGLLRPQTPADSVRVSISTARLGRDMLATANPPLTVAWVERGNPIPQNPETARVIEAFRRLEFRVVVEEFLTDTAREADVVLPAKNLFEQTDVIGAYWHPYLQLRPKVLEPPPGVKPETEIYRALGRRLGIDDERLAAALPGPSEDSIEAWLGAKLAPLGITLGQMRAGPVLSPEFEEVAFADRRFPTPSGRVELWSDEARARWGVAELPSWQEPGERPQRGGRFPLHLLTPNTKNRIHSQFGNLDTIRRMAPVPFVAMHPHDARERGAVAGDVVRVFNDRGELRLPVQFDYGLKPGCVAITNGFWLTEGAAVNLLSQGRETDMGHGAAFHDNAVQVERA